MPRSPRVTKGVIIVAGLGTRFLPATKATPKEMLPVLDKPVLQYIVEEMAESGIKEILFVTSSQKRAIEDHFDRDRELENYLEKKGKLEALKPLIALSEKVRFFYTRQSEPLGNGHALLCAKEFVGDEPFAFSDGDSIIDTKIPVIKQLLGQFRTTKGPIIGVQQLTDKNQMVKYGNLYARPTAKKGLYEAKELVEKPPLAKVSPEGLIVGGMRYILTKDIWPAIQETRPGKDGEIWLTDAVNKLIQKKRVFAYKYDGVYFDTGNKLSLLQATIHFAAKDPTMATAIREAVLKYHL